MGREFCRGGTRISQERWVTDLTDECAKVALVPVVVFGCRGAQGERLHGMRAALNLADRLGLNGLGQNAC